MRNGENATLVARLMDREQMCAYIGLGRTRGVEFARHVGAEKRVGRRCLYDRVVLDRAIDAMNGEGAGA